MNANEIARGLRYCYSEDVVRGCNGCPYHDREDDTCTTENLELQAADMIESLQAQLNQCKEENEAWGDNELLKFATNLADELAESQRRERAMVEDIKRMPSVWPCYACKHIGKMSNRCHKHDRECFEWRGLEEGESDE